MEPQKIPNNQRMLEQETYENYESLKNATEETIKQPLMLMDWNYQNVHNIQSNLEI